jgi:DNA-binding GntR family transcriptional regulator
MSDQAGTSERVYVAIKRHLANGGPRPGERIDVTDLCNRFSASATPVRSALFRLVGERLVAVSPGLGFRAPRFSEPALTDLYDWNATVLVGALRFAPTEAAVHHRADADLAPDDVVEGTERLFNAIASVAGNGEYQAAIIVANDRLRRVRRAERALIPDPIAELRELARQHTDLDLAHLRQGLLAYHRRRQRLVPALVRVLHGLGLREA